jgi:hypothetical protein
MLRATEYPRTDLLGPRPIAARTLSVFLCIRTLLTLPPVYIYIYKEAVVRNFCSQLLIMLRSETLLVPFVKIASEYSLLCYHIVVIS